jgi:hypothetical protein
VYGGRPVVLDGSNTIPRLLAIIRRFPKSLNSVFYMYTEGGNTPVCRG